MSEYRVACGGSFDGVWCVRRRWYGGATVSKLTQAHTLNSNHLVSSTTWAGEHRAVGAVRDGGGGGWVGGTAYRHSSADSGGTLGGATTADGTDWCGGV